MLNVISLMGRLTADPELRRTTSGVYVTAFTIAVDRDFPSNGITTDFIDIVAWRNTAEFVTKYFKKGKLIVVTGSLQMRSYVMQDGQKRYVAEVLADRVNFAGDKKQENAAPQQEKPAATFSSSFADIEVEEIENSDDLPF